jgi:hypothetical protein
MSEIKKPKHSPLAPVQSKHVGQFSQASIEILFTVCYGPGQRSGEPFKVLGCLL